MSPKTAKQKVRKPGDFRFGYDIVDENTKPEYEKIQRDDALAYIGWKATRMPSVPHAKAFSAWWLQKGDINFFTFEDQLRYKRELLQRITDLTAITTELTTTAAANA